MAQNDDAQGVVLHTVFVLPAARGVLVQMTALDSFDEFDGGVYNAGKQYECVRAVFELQYCTGKWKPDLGFVNPTASAVIWPPGYLHETSTLPTTDGSCGASITVYPLLYLLSAEVMHVSQAPDCSCGVACHYQFLCRCSMHSLSLFNSSGLSCPG